MQGWEKSWIPACPLGKTMCFNVLQCYFCPGPLLVCLSWRFSYKLNFLPGTLPIIGQRRFKKEIFLDIIFFEHFSLFFLSRPKAFYLRYIFINDFVMTVILCLYTVIFFGTFFLTKFFFFICLSTVSVKSLGGRII